MKEGLMDIHKIKDSNDNNFRKELEKIPGCEYLANRMYERQQKKQEEQQNSEKFEKKY